MADGGIESRKNKLLSVYTKERRTCNTPATFGSVGCIFFEPGSRRLPDIPMTSTGTTADIPPADARYNLTGTCSATGAGVVPCTGCTIDDKTFLKALDNMFSGRSDDAGIG